MKKYVATMIISLFFLLQTVPVFAATSNFGTAAILKGIKLTDTAASVTRSDYTDGSDTVTVANTEYIGTYGNGRNVSYTLTNPEYVESVYFRTAKITSTTSTVACIRLTFTDASIENVCTASLTTSTANYYVDVVNDSKLVKTIRVYASTDNIKLYEVDLKRNVNISAPAAPTNVQAIATSGKVNLSWTAAATATGYNIYKNGVKINSTALTGLTYEATEVKSNETQKWEITAINAIGESPKSVAITSFYDAMPTKPNGLQAVASIGKVELLWNTAANVTSYNIYQNGTKIGSTTNTYYTVTGLTDNLSYKWQVSGLNEGNESALSIEVVTMLDTIPPEKPTGLFATPLASGGKIQLEWISNKVIDGVTSYRIYKGNDLILTVGAVTKAVVSVEPNVTASYAVVAYDAAGNASMKSDPVQAVALPYPDTTPPDAPTNLIATGLDGKVQLSWRASKATDVDGYYIYRNGVLVNTTPTKATSYNVVGGLSWGTVYRFQVSAIDTSKNESEKSNIVTAAATQPLDTTAPKKPTGISASISSNADHIMLNWDGNTEDDLAGYYLYVSSDNLIFDRVSAELLLDPNAAYPYTTGNTLFYFRVTALDEYGNESLPSKSIQIKTPNRDPNESTENTKPSLIVSWEPITGAVGYLVYYNGSLVANLPAGQLQYEIKAEQGYSPASNKQNVDVKAKFLDGSIGENGSNAQQGKWGFSVSDLWQSSLHVIGTLAGFILLGIVISLSPRLIKLIRHAVQRRRSLQ